jgi:hypothetical protein
MLGNSVEAASDRILLLVTPGIDAERKTLVETGAQIEDKLLQNKHLI